MDVVAFFVLVLFLVASVCTCAENDEVSVHNPYLEALRKRQWESDQGYSNVRKDAYLFWWLYFADGSRKGSAQKPLIIWIQGGPGLAASGIANFAEIGPLTMDMQPRNHTWVKGRNVLLIDHPVGTGFSYAVNDNIQIYAKKDRTVALDLLRAIKNFLTVHPEFRETPAYIMSQSYGGKIAPRLTYMLNKAITQGKIKMNLKAVGIGSAWVHPKVTMKIFPEYLYHMGQIDINSYDSARFIVRKLVDKIASGDFKWAELLDRELVRELQVSDVLMNIAKPNVYGNLTEFERFVNEYVKPTLPMVNQSRSWTFDSNEAYDSLSANIMLPAFKFVERLLNETRIRVVVYNGNFDATCPMAGAVNWVHGLRWPRAREFREKQRSKIPGAMTGYYKAVGRLSLWWVFNAGHWVPEDNPQAMEEILKYTTNTEDDLSTNNVKSEHD